MNNTNLFKHAPKELVTDAFLTWLFYHLDSSIEYQKEKEVFFNQLILHKKDGGREVENIRVIRQETNKHGRVDLIVKFNFKDEDETEIHQILFENKTWTTTSNTQLGGYKKSYPDCYRYFYLKLAYINAKEQEIAVKYQYDIIDVNMLSEILSKVKHTHLFIEQYLEYINESFKNKISLYKEKLWGDNKEYNVLWDSQAQFILMDSLYEKLKGTIQQLDYRNGSSYGRPWTQIDICNRSKIFGDIDENIFWRIDIRANKFYIRLNQHARIKTEHVGEKNKRLNKLRSIFKEITCSNEYLDIKEGRQSNKGTFEREIAIFFLDDNNLYSLIEAIPKITIEFANKYKELK